LVLARERNYPSQGATQPRLIWPPGLMWFLGQVYLAQTELAAHNTAPGRAGTR
jgi:hypothetical protein